MKKQLGIMALALTATVAFAGIVSAKNWRDGLKAGQCKAHITTSGSTCEVSFRGDNCNLPSLNGTSAPGGVCTTADGKFKDGDDPFFAKKDEAKGEKK